MSQVSEHTNEGRAIAEVLRHYIHGAKAGNGDDMRPAFHEDATIFGYAGDELFAGPIQRLYDWSDENGPAANLRAHIASIDVVGTVATVRLELDNLGGGQFTDMFTLLKTDGEWKIMNKVFHFHG